MLGVQIDADTIGAAWLAVARRILDEGAESSYDAAPILELDRVTLGVARPASVDPIQVEWAEGLHLPVGRLDFVVKSAHIYEPEMSLMRLAVGALAA